MAEYGLFVDEFELFQCQRYSFIEVEDFAPEQIVIFGLYHIRCGFHPIGTHLIVFRGSCFSIGIFFTHQSERGFGRFGCRAATLEFTFGGYGIVIGLLDFFE